MNLLIEALLELARFSRVALGRQAVNLSEIFQTITAELQQNNPGRPVQFTYTDGILDFGDDQLLRIVLENLVGNAWKFTSKTALAQIEFNTMTETDGTLIYFVRDNGAGFNMDYAGKMFGAFQRLHREKDFPGIGIGLATVQRIIHRHGGRVWAEGAVDSGATFFFTI